MICTVSKNLVVNRNQIDHWQHLSVIECPSDKLSIIQVIFHFYVVRES
jgi:hypothetical protein